MKIVKTEIKAFTLIEMLAVMFIICIIFSIALPAFGPIMCTMKLTTAAENLANVLESARQHAITSGVDCYVVFPTTTGSTDMDYKAYKVYSYNGTTGHTVGKWEILAKGLQIDKDSTFLTQSGSIDIPFPEDNSGNSIPVNCVQFKPSGKATVDASVKVVDTNMFNSVTFYNHPGKVKVGDIGKEPDV